MMILFLSRMFYPHIGGVEKHCLELGRRLVERGHKVTVITEKPATANILVYQSGKGSAKLVGKRVEDEDRIDGIRIIRIDQGNDDWFKKFRIWVWLWKNRKVIKTADIVHCHDVFFWYLPFKFLFPNKKVFVTFHGYEGNKIPSKKAIFMHKIAEKLSKGNICVGDFLTKWYGTKPTYTTYGGVRILPINTNTTNKYQSKNKILFIGRLEAETGIMVYLEALNILKDKGCEFSLNVFGDGSLREKAEKFSKENNLNVKFMGFVKDAEKYIDNFNYIFTSRYLGILESLARKKIVFAVYNNKIKEDYLKMSPFAKWITIDESPKKLSEKIEDSIINRSYSNNSENSFDWAKKQSWTQMVEMYLALWKK